MEARSFAVHIRLNRFGIAFPGDGDVCRVALSPQRPAQPRQCVLSHRSGDRQGSPAWGAFQQRRRSHHHSGIGHRRKLGASVVRQQPPGLVLERAHGRVGCASHEARVVPTCGQRIGARNNASPPGDAGVATASATPAEWNACRLTMPTRSCGQLDGRSRAVDNAVACGSGERAHCDHRVAEYGVGLSGKHDQPVRRQPLEGDRRGDGVRVGRRQHRHRALLPKWCHAAPVVGASRLVMTASSRRSRTSSMSRREARS